MLRGRHLALLVLLGLVTAIVVAWGCAVGSGVKKSRGLGEGVENGRHVSAWRWDGRGAVFLDVRMMRGDNLGFVDPDALNLQSLIPPDLRTALQRAGDDAPAGPQGEQMFAVDARGWPLLCLWSEYHITDDLRATPHGGIAIPRNDVARGALNRMYPVMLPCRPLWRGLAINTAAFAAGWWGLLMIPRLLRADSRRRRGVCVRCGYDLAGLAKCPECGREAKTA